MNTDRFKHLAAFLRSILAVGVAFQIVEWTDAQIAVIIASVEALGALIYANNKTPT